MAYEQFMDQEITNAAGTSTIKLKKGGIAEIVKHEDEDKVGTVYAPGDDAYEFIREQIQGLTNNLLPANQLDGNRTYAVSGNYSYIGNPDGTVDWVSGTARTPSGAIRSASPDNPIKVSKGTAGYNEIVAENFGSPTKLQQQTQPAVDQGDLNKALGPVGGDAAAEEEEVAEATGVAEDGRPGALVTERQRALDKLFRQARRGEISERAAAALRGGMIASGIAVETQRETDTSDLKRGYIDAIVDLQDKMQALEAAEGEQAAKLHTDLMKTVATVVNARMAASGTVSAAKARTFGTEIARLGKEREKLDKAFSMTASDDKNLAANYGKEIRSEIVNARQPDAKLADVTRLLTNLDSRLKQSIAEDKIRIMRQFAIDSGVELDSFLDNYLRTEGANTETVKNIRQYVVEADDKIVESSESYRELRGQAEAMADDIDALGVGEGGQVARLYASLLGIKPGESVISSPEVADELGAVSQSLQDQIDQFNAALEADPTGVSSAQIKEAIMGTSEFEAFKEAVDPTGLQDPDRLFNQYRGQVRRLSRTQEKAAGTGKATRELEREKKAEKGYETETRGQALQKLFFPKKAKPVATAEGVEEVAEAEIAQETPGAEVPAEEAVVDTSTPAAAPTVVEAESPTPRAETEPTIATGAEQRVDQAEKRAGAIRRIMEGTRRRLADILKGKDAGPVPQRYSTGDPDRFKGAITDELDLIGIPAPDRPMPGRISSDLNQDWLKAQNTTPRQAQREREPTTAELEAAALRGPRPLGK